MVASSLFQMFVEENRQVELDSMMVEMWDSTI